ncbi:MAG: cytochrome P450 [Cyanophyceae cyanobacterium]
MTLASAETNLINPDLLPSGSGPPHEVFDLWRETDPVHWNPAPENYEAPVPGMDIVKGFWVLTKHKDVYDVSRNQSLFSSFEGGPLIWDHDDAGLALQRAGIMGMPPEQHGQIKRLVTPPFAPRELQAIQPEIDRLAGEIVDDVAAKGSCEFVFDVASRLPVYTFCKLMGIPEAMREQVFQLGNLAADTENRQNQEQNPQMQLFMIAHQLIEEKKANPDNAMLSRLIHGEVDGEKPNEDMIKMFFVILSIAGHETTRTTATHFIRLMNEHPDQYQLLRSDVDKYLPGAIDEVLRYSPPVVKFRRTAMEDTEVGGYKISKGDKIYLSYPAANRDPAIFEDPHRFDITRGNAGKHLSFGTGPHVCLGARLAKQQLHALLKEIVTRIPDIRPDGDYQMLRSIWFNAIIDMPVVFTPEKPG